MPTDPDPNGASPPRGEDAAHQALDDAIVSRAGHRSLVDHMFFQASREITHEQSQSIARIVISLLVSVILLFYAYTQNFTPITLINLSLGLGYAAYGYVHFLWTGRSRERHLWRRYLVIAGDLGLTSYVTYQFGLAGLGFYPLYLWIVIGNGLRFGPHYLRVATLVGVSGFVVANLLDGVLFQYPGVVVGLLVGLLLMPKFFLVMIRRLAEANVALKEQKEMAEHLAQHDALTGLPNRALLEDRLNRALALAARRGTLAAVIFIDLDGFKEINDTLGHEFGDLLLKQIAGCLSAHVRMSDTVARLGGDEFIILVEETRGSEEVAAIVEQLFACSGRHYTLGEHRAYTTWSCGVAIYPQDGMDGKTLIKNADTAMYRAKAAGENQFRLYDSTMSEAVAAQLKLREELRRAVSEDQFELLFQPHFDAAEERMVSAEASMRWRHPERGLLSPSDYLSIAERCGLTPALNSLGLRKTLDTMERWRREGVEAVEIFVDVSPDQLVRPDFAHEMKGLLDAHPLAARSLALEIAEGALILESPDTETLLAMLRDSGIRIALRDFGRDGSSLLHLARAPIQRIGIDPRFMQGVPQDERSNRLMEAVMDIARRFEIEVLVTGVENREQLEWLRQRRCDRVQGPLFGPPMSAELFRASLQKGAKTQAS
ncbi:MAG: hypothetical protein Kow006_12710 [Gammaproteobacteria bacterium]